MFEDITMSSSNSGQNPEKDSVTLEETSIKNTDKSSIICDWDPCSYKSKDRNNLINHIDERIGQKDDTKHDIADVIVIKEDSIIFEKEAVTVSEVKDSNMKTTCCDDCDFITCQLLIWNHRVPKYPYSF